MLCAQKRYVWRPRERLSNFARFLCYFTVFQNWQVLLSWMTFSAFFLLPKYPIRRLGAIYWPLVSLSLTTRRIIQPNLFPSHRHHNLLSEHPRTMPRFRGRVVTLFDLLVRIVLRLISTSLPTISISVP